MVPEAFIAWFYSEANEMNRTPVWLGLAGLLCLARASSAGPALGQHPFPPPVFVENRGQWPPEVRFAIHGGSVGATFLRDSFRLHWRDRGEPDPAHAWATLAFRLESASIDTRLEEIEPAGIPFNYFFGTDPARWVRRAPSFRALRYLQVAPGVDLEFRVRDGRLEYDIMVAPGSDLAACVFACEGAESLSTADPALAMHLSHGRFVTQDPPVTYCADLHGKLSSVACAVRLLDHDRFTFVAEGPSQRRLVVDPGFEFATYLGEESGPDVARDVAVDASGRSYFVGVSYSPDFPVTSGAVDGIFGADESFVAAFLPGGTGFAYVTFLGGSGPDEALGVAADPSHQAFVTGWSSSPDFPTTPNAFDVTANLPGSSGFIQAKGFVAKINDCGDALLYSTLIGGTEESRCRGIAIDDQGRAHVTGMSYSWDFPTTPGAYDAAPFPVNAFLARVSPAGDALEFSTMVGELSTVGDSVAVDDAGDVWIGGRIDHATLPMVSGSWDTTYNGSADVFLAKIAQTGATLLAATYLGGADGDLGLGGMALGPDGGPCIAGFTLSHDFPTSAGCFDKTKSGFEDAFVTRLDSTGSSLMYSTFLGSSQNDEANDLATGSGGAVYVTGVTWGTNFPTTAGAEDGTLSGLRDAFIAILEPDGSKLAYGSYLGGDNNDAGYGICVDAVGDVYVTGENWFGGMPLPPGSFDVTNGFIDAFAVKVDFCLGELAEHGLPCAGSTGVAPQLSAWGCPRAGSTVHLKLEGSAGVPALMLFGSGTGKAQLGGCFIEVLPLLNLVVPFIMPQSGSIVVSAPLPRITNPVTVSLQAVVAGVGPFGPAVSNVVSMSMVP